MKKSLRFCVLLVLAATLLTVSAFADTGPKPQLTVKVTNPPEELYYLDLLAEGDWEHAGDADYSGLDWSYSEEEIAALDSGLLDALRAADCDQLCLQISGPLSPMKIVPPEGDSFLFLVLPVRLKSEQ